MAKSKKIIDVPCSHEFKKGKPYECGCRVDTCIRCCKKRFGHQEDCPTNHRVLMKLLGEPEGAVFPIEVEEFCALCGKVRTPDEIDKKCQALITTTLSKAYSIWKEASERYVLIHGALVRRADWAYFYFRVDYWQCYPLTDQGKSRVRRNRTPILTGLILNKNGDEEGEIATYYTHPRLEGLCSYGERFSYPENVKDKRFWRKVEKQLREAPQAVFSDGIDDWDLW